MEYGKKSQDSQVIGALVEEIAFYMHHLAKSEVVWEDIVEYMDKIPKYKIENLSGNLNFIKENKNELFIRTEKIGYDDRVCDMLIDEMAKHFGVSK